MRRDQRKDQHRATPGDAEQRPHTPICYPTRYPQARTIEPPPQRWNLSTMARPYNSVTPRPRRPYWPSDLATSHSDGPTGADPPGPDTPGSAWADVKTMPGTTRRVIVLTGWAVYVKPALSTLVVRSRAHWTPEWSGHRHRQDRHPTAEGPAHLQESAACATT